MGLDLSKIDPALAEQIVEAWEWEQRDAERHPLAWARLWHSERSSQVEAARLALSEGLLYVFILGGNRCIGGETMVRLSDGTERRIDEFEDIDVVRTPLGPRAAMRLDRKGPDRLYRVKLSSGDEFTATLQIIAFSLLTAHGCRFLDSGPDACSPIRGPVRDTDQPTRPQGALRLIGTGADSRCCCRSCRRSDGEPPLQGGGTGRSPAPSPGGARQCSHRSAPGRGACGHQDETAPKQGHTRPCQCGARPSSSGGPGRVLGLGVGSGWSDGRTTSRLFGAHTQVDPRTTGEYVSPPRSSAGSSRPATHVHGSTYQPPVVVDITYDRTDYHYDLHVPEARCFVASGAIHHNSGKTELAAQLAVAVALGSDDPQTQRWAEVNGLDLSRVGAGPGVVVIGSGDSNDSRRVMRPKVARYVPSGSKWRNRDGQGEAEVVMPGGAKIIFKSVDQGRDGWQGFSARLIVFDEEPSDLGVVNEALIRLADQRGWLVFSMTPLMGWTPLLEEHLRGEQADDVKRYSLYGPDNPHVDAEALRAIYRKYGSHERAAREKGDIVALEGRIYTDWDRAVHVVKAFIPPSSWPRFVGIDFGTRNPTAVIWLALDPRDDTMHVYREHYAAGETQEWHCKRYRSLTDCEPEVIIADAAGTAERMTWHAQDVITAPAYKGPGSVRAGISAVAERLALDAEGRPHLVIHDNCPATIREIEGYVWKSRKTKADLPDEPEKRNDHALDAIRYVVHHLSRLGGLY